MSTPVETTNISGPILVCAAIIRDGERFLLAQRLPDAKIEAGKWEFPGGKVEPGEHPETALTREIHEELDLEIEIDRHFSISSHVYQTKTKTVHIVLLSYLCHIRSGVPRAVDVADFRWVNGEELRQIDLAEADWPLLAQLFPLTGC